MSNAPAHATTPRRKQRAIGCEVQVCVAYADACVAYADVCVAYADVCVAYADVCYSAQYYFQALITRSWLQSAGTSIYVSAYLYICVLIPLYVCPHNSICVSSCLYICPHASICVSSVCVSSYLYICPHASICPHTSMCLSSYPYILYKCRRFSLWCPAAMVNPSLLTYADVC
jgi:hypothetical protein